MADVTKEFIEKVRECALGSNDRLLQGYAYNAANELERQQAEITKLREALSQCGPVLSPQGRQDFEYFAEIDGDLHLDLLLKLNDNVTKARLTLLQGLGHD